MKAREGTEKKRKEGLPTVKRKREHHRKRELQRKKRDKERKIPNKRKRRKSAEAERDSWSEPGLEINNRDVLDKRKRQR